MFYIYSNLESSNDGICNDEKMQNFKKRSVERKNKWNRVKGSYLVQNVLKLLNHFCRFTYWIVSPDNKSIKDHLFEEKITFLKEMITFIIFEIVYLLSWKGYAICKL